MTLTPRLVSELIRQRLGLPDDSQAARIINLIPQSLKAFGRKVAADPFLREQLFTDRAVAILPISSSYGEVDLQTGFDTYGFLMEYLDRGRLYYLPAIPVDGVRAFGDLTVLSAATGFAHGTLAVVAALHQATGSITLRVPVKSTGILTFVGTPTSGETIHVNGAVLTFLPTPPPGTGPEAPANVIYFTADPNFNAVSMATALTAISQLSDATYTAVTGTVQIQYKTFGANGDAFQLANSSGNHCTTPMTHLTGGVNNLQEGEFMYVNGFLVVWQTSADAVDDGDALELSLPITDNVETNAYN